MKNKLAGYLIITFSFTAYGQKSDKTPRFFADPIVSDSATTILIPTRYNADILTSSKIALWSDFYANIIFYDVKSDTTKRLFSDDTFIEGFSIGKNPYYSFTRTNKPENISSKWIFYFVKPADYDRNGRIDNDDPSILYVSDKFGNGLKSITPTNENAETIDVFDKQGFALIKMQRDMDNDFDFESNDKDFYYVKLDLNTLTLGNKIELKR